MESALDSTLEATSLPQLLVSLGSLCYRRAEKLLNEPRDICTMERRKMAKKWKSAARKLANLATKVDLL